MSARNYILSAREHNLNKIVDCLPQINKQKFGNRSGRELPALSANSNCFINRNIDYSFKLPYYTAEDLERAGTPYSDFFSESETGTPDFISEESDSSAGSALNRNTTEATNTLSTEWERIERTLYDEDGEQTNRPQIIEECEQWKQLHPQLRIVGKVITLPEKRFFHKPTEHEEVIAMHYSDYEQFSESEERLSQSSTDVTPQNSPRVSFTDELDESKLSREKIPFYQLDEELGLTNAFCSLLHITPIQIRSPPTRRQNTSIIKSDLASSKWMRGSRPDSSNFERSSAKSFVSLDTKNYKYFTHSENNKIINGRVMTARQRDMAKLEPLYTPPHNDNKLFNGSQPQYTVRKVSLPPLLVEEERKKVCVSSAKKIAKYRKATSKGYLDKIKHG